MHRLLVVVVAGCGRLGFDGATPIDANGDGQVADAPATMPDAPNDAVTVTFGERATAMHRGTTTDTYLNGSAGDFVNNFGGSDELRVRDEEHGLLRFDVSAIPATATVFSASLELVVESVEAQATVAVHRVLEPWTESNLNGLPGTSNWVQRQVGQAWATAGASPPSSAGPELVSIGIAAPVTVTFTLPEELVQAWVTSAATNHGVVLLNPTGDRVVFWTSEAADPDRPLLTVTFVP